MSLEISENFFLKTLDKFLMNLKRELDLQRPINSIDSIETLDQYLMELNSYYYRSFHENFMPGYKQDIHSHIKHLLDLKVEENLLTHHAALTIKRYAALHNQVKSLRSRLIELKLRLKEKKEFLTYALERQRLDLLYALKQLRDGALALAKYAGFLNDLSLELEKHNSLPGDSGLYMDWIMNCREYNLQDPQIHDLFYQLQKNQRLIRNILQHSSASGELAAGITEIGHILNQMNNSINKEGSLKFYKSYFLQTCQHYSELITLYLQLDNPEQAKEIIAQFNRHLEKWINSMEFILPLLSNPFWQYLPELSHLNNTNPAYIQELYKDILAIREHIEPIGQKLDSASRVDYDYLSAQIENVLEFSAPLIKTISNESALFSISPLAACLQQLNYASCNVTNQNRIIIEQNLHLSRLNADFDSLLDYLESKIALLNDIIGDILRFLSPHNISRTWKHSTVRVEQIQLSKGRRLAAEYEYLLDKYGVITQISDQDDLTVLYEEGDIFLIRVDNETMEEIPYMIIAKKG